MQTKLGFNILTTHLILLPLDLLSIPSPPRHEKKSNIFLYLGHKICVRNNVACAGKQGNICVCHDLPSFETALTPLTYKRNYVFIETPSEIGVYVDVTGMELAYPKAWTRDVPFCHRIFSWHQLKFTITSSSFCSFAHYRVKRARRASIS